METVPLAAVSFLMSVVAVLFVIVCVALIFLVLIQKGRGGGLSSAFGGAGAGGLFGTKTGDFLTWVTIAAVALFLSLAVIMGLFYKPTVTELEAEQPRPPQPVPTAPSTDRPGTTTPAVPPGGETGQPPGPTTDNITEQEQPPDDE